MELKVESHGMEEVMEYLENLEGVAESVIDQALVAGAEVMAEKIKKHLWPFRDTAATVKEITVSEPFTENGVRKIKIHWRGPKNRYRIIHLNEWGTVRAPNPPAKGAIQRAMRAGESQYYRTLKSEIEKGLS